MAEFKIDRLRFTWAGAWATGIAYAKDSVVSFNGQSYVCLINHTSGSFNADLNHVGGDDRPLPYWILMLDGHTWIGVWTPSTSYSLNNIIIFGGNAYICKFGHTAGLTFDPYYWDIYGTFDSWKVQWDINTTYGVGDIVKYGGRVFRCITAHTSNGSFTDGLETDIINWNILVDNIEYLGQWSNDFIRYKPNDVVTLGAEAWICTTGHISADPFDPDNWAVWIPGADFGGTWDSATVYQVGDVVMYGGYSYINNTPNNTNNVPSVDSINWSLFTKGYELKTEWSGIDFYKVGDVVTVGGQSFVAIADNLNQNPTAVTLTTEYVAAGSAGTTVKVSNIIGILPGMIVSGVGFIRGQIVKSVSAGTLVLNDIPDTVNPPVDGETLTLLGINYVYWKPLVQAERFTSKWIVGTAYDVGDTAGWKNATYKCIKKNTASVLNRPDVDVSNTYWVLFLQNDVYNALNDLGDTVSFRDGKSLAIPIGTESYILKSVDKLPTWSTIFITPNVYYVATNGIDSPERGTTWDIPWKTIKYATDRVALGVLNANARHLLNVNKEFIVGEAYEWMVYQKNNNLSPFAQSQSNFPDEEKTKRDTRYIVDAVIYDVCRGGNSQTVANTLEFFDTEYGNKFKTPGIAAEITYFIAVVNYVYSLINYVLANTAPGLEYQAENEVYTAFSTMATATEFGTNNITVADATQMTISQPIVFNGANFGTLVAGTTYYIVDIVDETHIKIAETFPSGGVFAMVTDTGEMTVTGEGTRAYQVIDLAYTTEVGVTAKIATLKNIMITAFTNGNITLVPPMNQGATATIFVKSGTYAEQIPITVPANAAVVGDELRGVTVIPANSVKTLCTRTTAGGNNLFTVGSTNNMEDGTPVQFVSLNPVSTAAGYAYIDTTFGNVVAGQTYYVIGSTVTNSQFKVRVAGKSVATIGLGAEGSGYSQGLTTTTTAPETVGGVRAVITAVVDPLTGSISTYNISNVGSGYINPPTVTVTKPLDATANFLSGGVTADIIVDTVFRTIYKGMTASGTGITSGQTVLDVQFDTPNFAQVTITLSAPPDDTPADTITFSDTGSGAIPGMTTITQQNVPFTLTTNNGFMYVYGGGALGDMFRLQNGTGLRNMTFSGMLGTLSAVNSYGTRRPTGGSCVALDPGTGPDDTSAWIISKSPYIQNCTNFGSGAVGMKVDSTIHNGGQHSMVCNDFTQILSDGIGVWVTGGDALVEAVSVFAYFCYAGYLSENGGRSRATNGNSSYGDFGVLSEGYDVNETPITGTANNRASQATSSAVSSFGASAQILKIQYTNAGQSYGTSVTNLLKHSNNFLGASWVNDGNVVLAQSGLTPYTSSEAWALSAVTSVTDSSYMYQNIKIAPSGGKFTNLSGGNYGPGSGAGATFDVTVTPNGYVVTVNQGGSNYVVGNQILIIGSVFGGGSPLNDLIITVDTVQAPSAVLTVTSQGVVPLGTNQYYALSIFAKQGTSNAFDLYATFSGGLGGSVSSAVTYNFVSGLVVGSSQDNGGTFPITVSAIPQTGGWYRITFVVNDATGLNNNLQFRIYPRTRTGIAGTTYFYGGQVEMGGLVNYYLENNGNTYSAYANYKINGAGTGAIVVGDEIRSGSVYQAVIAAGGTGFVTANNNAQGGNSGTGYLVLAQSDTASATAYVGMRLLVTSGLGAGQYGYIANFNPSNKYAYVLKESFTPVLCLATESGTNDISVSGLSDFNTLYAGQMVQFIPTTFTTTVTTISQNQVTATQTIGGLTNVIVVSSTARLALNMGITFTGTTFGQITPGYTYYIVNIVDSTKIQISTSYGGVIWTLVDGSGSMTINYPANTGYLQGPTTNMLPNYSIQFTGTVLGDIVVGQYYYVNDVIDSTTFTIALALRSLIITNTTVSTDPTRPNQITVNASTDTGNLTPLNPIYFTGTSAGGLNTTGLKYYISNIPDTLHFTVSSTLVTTTATQVQTGSNLITVTSTTGFVSGNPVQFTGTTFGNIVAGTTYYVAVINSPTTFTISVTPGGGAFNVGPVTRTGSIICRTTGVTSALTTATVSITGTTTTPQINVAPGTGSMTGTFQPPLFGGLTAGTNYYVLSTSTVGGNKFKVTSTQGGSTAVTLNDAVGSMQVAHAGWDNINPGTPDTAVFDSTSTYYIEPRLQFSAPQFSSTTAVGGSLTSPANYINAAYGDGKFMTIPSTGTRLYYSNNLGTWQLSTLPSDANWTGIAYGNHNWVITSAGADLGNSVALYSNSNGEAWKITSMPSSSYWSTVTYGNGKFVAVSKGRYYKTLTPTAVSSSGLGASVSIGTIGTSYTVTLLSAGTGYATNDTIQVLGTSLGGTTPANDATLTVTSQVGGLIQTLSVAGTAVTGGNAQPAYSDNFGATWTTGSGISTLPWVDVTYGLGKFVAIARSSRNVATSTDGITWTVTTNALPTTTTWSKITYGNNKFVAVSSTAAKPAYSLDGITWYESPYTITADTVAYGQGVYAAQRSSDTTGYISEDGILWIQKSFAIASSILTFGYPSTDRGTFLSLFGTDTAGTTFAGIRTQARPTVVGGSITAITMWEPGSNYSSAPVLTYTDPNNTSDASISFRTENGVLGGPSFVSRGTNYNTTSTAIDIRGNGVADNYQVGLNFYVSGLTKLPAPGDNLTIGASPTTYKVTSATALFGTVVPNISGLLTISPALTATTAPVHTTPIQIRQRYSQVRLTNHDFLNVGYGNTFQSNYPGFPEATGLNKANYTVESNNGRVFYSSTDQDGNFSVGGLFGVEQATGIVTLSASQFGLTGLSQLKLGGVSIGSSQVIISAFSTDSSFLANSNTIIPTQKAIKAYLTGRLSQGGSNTFTGLLTAGTVQVGGPDKIGSTVTEGQAGWVVNMKSKVMVNGQFGGVDGDLSALSFFFKSQGFRG